MRTLDPQEAAAFLKMHPAEVRRRAKRGQIPGGKAGRALEFIDQDFADFVRSLYAQPRQALQVTLGREQGHKATIETDKIHLRWLDRFLGGRPLDQINRTLVDRITQTKLGEGVSNATANRVLEVLRAVLRKAENEWDWLDKAPKIRMLPEPARGIRFLARDEAQRLLAALPEHLADMAAFSLATGLRQPNATGLEWSQLDLSRSVAWIHADQAKARKAIAVPLNAEATGVLLKQVGKHATHVFSFRGKPITQVSTEAWYAALERTGIQDFRWHDLRHT